jgi:hypothetical protein
MSNIRNDHLFQFHCELKDYVQNIMTLSYYHCLIGSEIDASGRMTVATNCSEDVFDKITQRALCEMLNARHPGYFFVTQAEADDIFFMGELLKKSAWERSVTIFDEEFYIEKFGDVWHPSGVFSTQNKTKEKQT